VDSSNVIIEQLQQVPLIAWLIAFGIIIIALAAFTDALSKLWDFGARVFGGSSKRRPSKPVLKKRVEDLANRLIQFTNDRQPHEVKAIYSRPLTFENFPEVSRETVEYSTTTQNLYAREFGAQMEAIKDECAKYGITHEALENHRKYTTNTIGLRAICAGLAEVAAKL
jgi:hypothetical protein